MTWTTLSDLRAQVDKIWRCGRILSDLEPRDLFPRRLRLAAPTPAEWSERFEAARAWTRELESCPHLRLEKKTVRHRTLGENDFPIEAWIDSPESAVRWIGRLAEFRRFAEIVEATRTRCPAGLPWLVRRPLDALELAESWSRLLDVALWLRHNPRPGIYLRELDLPGIDTKFVEAHRFALTGLLDLVLPAGAIDASMSGTSRFEARFGFREKPTRIRFRLLDPAGMPGAFGGASDLEFEASAFAEWDPPGIEQVFVVENETTFLAMPRHPRALVVFGAGYGMGPLGSARWMRGRDLRYWGDLDTHGFAILDEFRRWFPEVRSILMDHPTLLAHRQQWTTEPKPSRRDLQRLTPDERAIYDDLRDRKWGRDIRLEQERIRFGLVRKAIGT